MQDGSHQHLHWVCLQRRASLGWHQGSQLMRSWEPPRRGSPWEWRGGSTGLARGGSFISGVGGCLWTSLQCQDPDLTGSDLRVNSDTGRSKRQQHLNHKGCMVRLKRGPNNNATKEGPAPYQHWGGTELPEEAREAPRVGVLIRTVQRAPLGESQSDRWLGVF